MKTALSIAGSDSGGGAGIQADIKTMTMNGVYAMTAVTALTAQNTTGVSGIMEVTPDFLLEQIDDVFTDIRPDAVKIGMVSSSDLIKVIAGALKKYRAENIVVDPVMVATSGAKLISDDAVSTLKKYLLPLASIVTPNIPEAEVLSGMEIRTPEDMITAAGRISEEYGCAVLCKGGHSLNDANDLLYHKGSYRWFRGKRIMNPNTHGTGCTLSSAIAANLAKGFDTDESVRRAKNYISGALAAMLDLGKGSGPMNHAFALKGENSTVKVSERLVDSERQLFDEYTKHPFVQGIGSGTLDREKFRYYLIQDYLYLIDYAGVFALGAAKAKNLKAMKIFAGYVSQIMSGEMDIHRGYMERFGISLQEAESAEAALDNLSYTSYMKRIAYEEGEAEIAAAILSCAVSYEIIARNILQQYPGSDRHPFYGEWIRGYTSDEYHRENLELMELVDELTEGYTEEQVNHLLEVFHICTLHEGAFWDMAWNYETNT